MEHIVCCNTCGLVQRMEELAGGCRARCARCNFEIQRRIPGSASRTLALALGAAILYAPAKLNCNAFPIVAATAREAFALLQSENPDVLVSDIGMPAEDGYALIRQVRALDEASGGRIPAIALTAYAQSEDRTKVMEAGFQQYLAKPVEPAELIAEVANLVNRHASRNGG